MSSSVAIGTARNRMKNTNKRSITIPTLLQLCSNDELCVAIVSEALCLSLRELGRRAVSKCHTCALS